MAWRGRWPGEWSGDWEGTEDGAAPCDVKVSWLALDTAAAPCDVKVSWLALDTAYAVQVPDMGGPGSRPQRGGRRRRAYDWLLEEEEFFIFAR